GSTGPRRARCRSGPPRGARRRSPPRAAPSPRATRPSRTARTRRRGALTPGARRERWQPPGPEIDLSVRGRPSGGRPRDARVDLGGASQPHLAEELAERLVDPGERAVVVQLDARRDRRARRDEPVLGPAHERVA